jgi:hypothetical protein
MITLCRSEQQPRLLCSKKSSNGTEPGDTSASSRNKIFDPKPWRKFSPKPFKTGIGKARNLCLALGQNWAKPKYCGQNSLTLLRQFEIHSLLDLPCGDFNWMQHVDLQGIKYTGGDIVEALVARIRHNTAMPSAAFFT